MDSFFPVSRRWAGVLILAMWVASLILPVFSACNHNYDETGGWFLLAAGWFGFLVLQPAWLANWFILAVGVVLVLNKRPPIWLGMLAGIFAAPAWWWKEWNDDSGSVPICHYHSGYWLWLAVAGVCVIVPFLTRHAPDAESKTKA